MLNLIFNEQIYDEVIEKRVMKAGQSVWIATANVKNMAVNMDRRRDSSVIDLFEALAARGVETRLLHSAVPSGQFIENLRKSPLVKSKLFGMKRCVRSHFKCALVDSRFLYLGSANLTGAGMGMKSDKRRNFETGIITDNDNMMDMIAEYFNNIWTGVECVSCERKSECVAPLESPFG